MTDTTTEAVEAAWEEYEASAKPCGNDGDMEFFSVDSMTEEAYNIYTIAKAIAAERDALRAALVTAEAQAQTARDALEFYGDVRKYLEPLTGGMGDLWYDCGLIARAALAMIQPTPTTPALRALSKETDDDNA
jgi:hypothetical protein